MPLSLVRKRMGDDKKNYEEGDERGSHYSLERQSKLPAPAKLANISDDLRVMVIRCVMKVDANVQYFAT